MSDQGVSALPTDAAKTPPSRDPVLSCQGLEKVFHDAGSALRVLRDVSLEVSRGEAIAIVGASGSGKSTLLHLLGGLDIPTSGDVHVEGERIADMTDAQRGRVRNASLGFIYQFHHLLPEFTALENVAMPLLIRRMSQNEAMKTARAILDRSGLSDRLDHKPAQLSGGERQRAAVARALVTRPRCVLADEPTGNLDEDNAQRIFDLMLELNREAGTSLVVVTHDQSLAKRMDRIWSLEHGVLRPA